MLSIKLRNMTQKRTKLSVHCVCVHPFWQTCPSRCWICAEKWRLWYPLELYNGCSLEECWRAISSRIVSVRIRLHRCTSCRVNRSRQSDNIYSTVVSVYAPTFCSPQEHKDHFYDDLMCTINSVCQEDLLLVVGDFNARVGSNQLDSNNAEWSVIRVKHGVSNVNKAGRALLTFCAVNGLTMMIILYERKDIYKYTWQHPHSKMWSKFWWRNLRELFVEMPLSSIGLTAGQITNWYALTLLCNTSHRWLDNMWGVALLLTS